MKNNSIFITGTNTDIGKTLISAMIMSAAQSQKINLRYFKPIQTGTDLDEETVRALANLGNEEIIKSVFSFQLPAAPYRAALAENKKIDLNLITNYFKKFSSLSCVVEGAGGLLVPLTEKLLVRDLIQILNVPLLIVASTQLGTINHILLTIEAAQAKKIPIKGLILSGMPDKGLSDALRQFTDVPILAQIPWLKEISFEYLKKISPTIFDKKLLKKIFQ